MTALTLAAIAEMTGGSLKGDPGYEIIGISAPEAGTKNTISPLWEKKFLDALAPEAVLLTKKGWLPEGRQGVETDEPRVALTALLYFFEKNNGGSKRERGVHPTAVVSPCASIGANVFIGARCVIEAATVGEGTVVEAGAYIGDGAVLGEGCLIEPGAVIYHDVTIGKNCIIHANAVVGCDGFGFVPDAQAGLLRIPQIGTVIIGDNVEIGVCSSIDRATFGETVISRGTKIDSHVKVGHNCVIGEFCIIVSQSGVAGSSVVGNGVVLGAQTGVANHATIGDRVTVAGRGGVVSDIASGKTVSGFPARDHREDLRAQAAVRRVPELMDTVKALRRKVEELEKRAKGGENS